MRLVNARGSLGHIVEEDGRLPTWKSVRTGFPNRLRQIQLPLVQAPADDDAPDGQLL